jgi:hypothetical protein
MPCVVSPRCQVSFSGSVISADLFASGTYTVRAKVPPASGTRWAIWIYHNEYHLPRDCSEYTCYCGSWGKQVLHAWENSCHVRVFIVAALLW